jgi:hypothetical protein
MTIKRGFCFKGRKLMSGVWKLCVSGRYVDSRAVKKEDNGGYY